VADPRRLVISTSFMLPVLMLLVLMLLVVMLLVLVQAVSPKGRHLPEKFNRLLALVATWGRVHRVRERVEELLDVVSPV
jgi:hypothetical protein